MNSSKTLKISSKSTAAVTTTCQASALHRLTLFCCFFFSLSLPLSHHPPFAFSSYIDHGNGLLCLRLFDAFDLDSGLYTCHITSQDGVQCFTSTSLNIERRGEQSSMAEIDSLTILKSPLPVLVTDTTTRATFCARVYPSDARVTWYVCGQPVNENPNDDDGDDSCQFTVSFFFYVPVCFWFAANFNMPCILMGYSKSPQRNHLLEFVVVTTFRRLLWGNLKYIFFFVVICDDM